MSELSLHQRIVNAAASQEVENVKARHTYLHGRADATGEWDEIWCMDENASWAQAFGRMRGGDQVWWGSVGDYDAMCFQNWLEIRERYGGNAILKGTDLQEGATARERNQQIGGHRA